MSHSMISVLAFDCEFSLLFVRQRSTFFFFFFRGWHDAQMHTLINSKMLRENILDLNFHGRRNFLDLTKRDTHARLTLFNSSHEERKTWTHTHTHTHKGVKHKLEIFEREKKNCFLFFLFFKLNWKHIVNRFLTSLVIWQLTNAFLSWQMGSNNNCKATTEKFGNETPAHVRSSRFESGSKTGPWTTGLDLYILALLVAPNRINFWKHSVCTRNKKKRGRKIKEVGRAFGIFLKWRGKWGENERMIPKREGPSWIEKKKKEKGIETDRTRSDDVTLRRWTRHCGNLPQLWKFLPFFTFQTPYRW